MSEIDSAGRIKELRFNQLFALGLGLAVLIVFFPALPELGFGGQAVVLLIWGLILVGYLANCELKIRRLKRRQ